MTTISCGPPPQGPGDDADLRRKAREVVQSETLPNRRPDRSWGGRGGGFACTVCRIPVTADEFEVELEFARPGDLEPDTHHVHVRCFHAWQTERDGRAES